MHQKYPYFLRLLYYIQIGFIVFVPGHTGLIPMQFAFLSVPASVFFSFQFVLCFSLFETRRCVVVMSKDLKLNPSVLPVLLETRKCLFFAVKIHEKKLLAQEVQEEKSENSKEEVCQVCRATLTLGANYHSKDGLQFNWFCFDL